MSVKRLLDCTPSDLAAYRKTDLLDAIAGSEGRVLACETIGLTPPLLVDVTNAEYAAALSADILLLNMFDVQHPVINALPKVPEAETVRELKRLTGRVIGINLEPCDPEAAKSNDGTLWKMSSGRLATVENARRAADMGVDLIVLTGNPGNGVSNELIVASLKEISAAVGDRVMLAAGKMHASGVAGGGCKHPPLQPPVSAHSKISAAASRKPATTGAPVLRSVSGGWWPPDCKTQPTPSACATSKSWTESPIITARAGAKPSSFK